MRLWFDLVTRELLMVAILLALGSGLTTFLGERFDRLSRFALAPVLGLCFGVSAFTTLIYFFPAQETAWLLPVLAAASLGYFSYRWSRKRQGQPLAEATPRGNPTRKRATLGGRWPALLSLFVPVAQIAIVFVAVSGPINLTLHETKSTGPVFYRIVDALGYIAETDGEVHQTLPQAAQALSTAHPRPAALANLSDVYWERYAGGFQEIDVTPLSANLDALIGLGSAQTQAPFLVAILFSGALGVFAAIRYFARRARWSAVLGSSLFGGAFFLQLFFDGSQAAIAGMALLLPLALVGIECLRVRRVANLALFALLAAGLVAIYPLFVPEAAIAAVVVLAARSTYGYLLRSRRSGQGPNSSRDQQELESREVAGRFAVSRFAHRPPLAAGAEILLVLVLVPLFDLVAFSRAARYWNSVAHGGFLHAGLPVYDLSAAIVPGWLGQSRQFYGLSTSGQSVLVVGVFAVGVPLLIAAVAAVGVWRYRWALVVVLFIAIFATLGLYEQAGNGCSYCEDRVVLPIAPLTMFLIGLGVAAIASSAVSWVRFSDNRVAWARTVSVGAALLILLPSLRAMHDERALFSQGAYALPAATHSLLSHVPKGATVDLEAFNSGGMAPAEQFYTYELASEMTDGHVSLPADVEDHDALAYVGTFPLPGPQFRPNYSYVLTRAPAIRTSRKIIASKGGMALEKRVTALGVTLDSGVTGAPLIRDDPSGKVLVDPLLKEPVRFVVSGGDPRVPAFVEVRFLKPPPGTSATSSTPINVTRSGEYLDVCVEAAGSAPVRTANIQLEPSAITELAAMYVSAGKCSWQH